jgi:bifunctional non-homologous end joining protein LigD
VAADRLNTYRSKRDFSKTSEPAGGETNGAGDPIFVIQKHAARSLHYDFRLEVDGALASWAVPKGPSYDPKAKRLAVHVEDHPLDYQDFEGKIPGGEYGGGEVIVWDSGTYQNMTEDRGKAIAMRKAIERGHFSVWLEGTKLRGGWAFTRTSKEGDRQDGWIMVKRKDELANPKLDITKAAPQSTKTQRRIEELKDDDGPTWTRARATYVSPMLAQLAKSPPRAGDFVYERKLDGLRAIAVRNGTDVELWSRGHQSFNRRFAKIVEALAALLVDNFTLDGEIVAYDGEQTSFALLQAPGSSAQPVYEVFDVLHLLGNDTRKMPLADRRRLVAELFEADDLLRPVEILSGDPDRLLRTACRKGWEGLIAKRAESPYRSGRSPDWRKLKCSASQELVIGGYTEPQGKRSQLGAILVGYYENDGRLHYAGKVGTGFSEATLLDLGSKLARRPRQESPFVDTPRVKGAHWAKPDLVANIGFSEWTAAGKLRHPRFEGLRSDKKAADVRRERPSAP